MSAAPRHPSAARDEGPPPPCRAAPWVWAAASAAFGALPAALVSTGWQPLLDLDAHVSRALHDSALAHPGWTSVARVFTDWVWDTVTIRVLIAVVFVVLWRRGERALAFLLAVTMLAAVLVQQGLKAMIGRERPEWEEPVDAAHYSAMPSGHAMTAALACALLTWLAWSRLDRPATRWAVTASAALSTAGVSFTRVYLGVHWVTDVIVGMALGVAITALAVGSWQLLRATGKIAA